MENIKWSALKKFWFLFLAFYLALYMIPFPLHEIEFTKNFISFYTKSMDFLTIWIGNNIFGIPEIKKITLTGSGDTFFDYVQVIAKLLIALILSVIFYFVTLKRNNFITVHKWLIVFTRYYLGLYMLYYGFAKLYDGQFGAPYLERLEQPYGNSSPMGLLWTFMGASKAYTIFSGLCEIIGGSLLFFRRTMVVGSIVTCLVMLNVFVLNLCYDVPVKLFSAHLMLISLFIASPYLKSIMNFFIGKREAKIDVRNLVLPKKWMKIGRLILKPLIIIGIPLISIWEGMSYSNNNKIDESLNGFYKTITFKINKDSSNLVNDTIRWRSILLAGEYADVKTVADSVLYFGVKLDTLNTSISLTNLEDSTDLYNFKYKKEPNKRMYFYGAHNKDSIHMFFKYKQNEDYRLINRGFHWVNEYPYNR